MTCDLSSELRSVLGAQHVLDDAASCRDATSDLFPAPGAVPAALVIRPKDTDQTSRAMSILARAKAPVVARGAGLSYTGGVVPDVITVVLDTCRMTDIRIDPANLSALVGAGVSWQILDDALKGHELRVAQPTPISGAFSTVGGLAAQSIPGGTEGILGLAVVLADGSTVQTGALAVADAPPFWRALGPDLTGLFLGDCGAFGVKTEVAVRLMARRPAAFASFAFDDGAAMMDVLVEVMHRGLGIRTLAMDPVRGRDASKIEPGEALKTVGAVLGRTGGLRQAVRDMTQLARGAAQLGAAGWTLHLTAEGVTTVAGEEAIEIARRLALNSGGREVAPALPTALHARPYSIRGFVGPEGERWVPVHGILPLGAAKDCLVALERRIDVLRPRLEQEGVSISHIVASHGPYVTVEPMFYWPDELDPVHLRYLSERNRARFGHSPARPQARDAVRAARRELGDIIDAHGAVHAQVGRYYALRPRLTPGGATLLDTIKKALDPEALMNPGVLGLSRQQRPSAPNAEGAAFTA